MKIIKKKNQKNEQIVPFFIFNFLKILMDLFFLIGFIGMTYENGKIIFVQAVFLFFIIFMNNFYRRKVIIDNENYIIKSYLPFLYKKTISRRNLQSVIFEERIYSTYSMSFKLKENYKVLYVGATYNTKNKIKEKLVPYIQQTMKIKNIEWVHN